MILQVRPPSSEEIRKTEEIRNTAIDLNLGGGKGDYAEIQREIHCACRHICASPKNVPSKI